MAGKSNNGAMKTLTPHLWDMLLNQIHITQSPYFKRQGETSSWSSARVLGIYELSGERGGIYGNESGGFAGSTTPR